MQQMQMMQAQLMVQLALPPAGGLPGMLPMLPGLPGFPMMGGHMGTAPNAGLGSPPARRPPSPQKDRESSREVKDKKKREKDKKEKKDRKER